MEELKEEKTAREEEKIYYLRENSPLQLNMKYWSVTKLNFIFNWIALNILVQSYK